MQQWPRSLQIWDLGDAGEEAFVLGPLRGKLVCAERRAKNEKALAIAWRRPIPCPDGFLAVAAKVGDVCRLLSSRVPNAGLATVELNARMLAKCLLAGVQQLPDVLGNCDNINAVEVYRRPRLHARRAAAAASWVSA